MPILWRSATLAHDRRHDDEFAPGLITEVPVTGLLFAAYDEGWHVLNEAAETHREETTR